MSRAVSTLAAVELYSKHEGGDWMHYPVPQEDPLMNILRDLQCIISSGVLEEEPLHKVAKRIDFRTNLPFHNLQDLVDLKAFTFLWNRLYTELHGEEAKQQPFYVRVFEPLLAVIMELEHTQPKKFPQTSLYLVDH